MEATQNGETPARPQRAAEEAADRDRLPVRSRQWIGRAAFEAGLIVLGLIGALVVEEWRDTRQREVRVRGALESIRNELAMNRAALDEVLERNAKTMDALRESERTGRIYEGGIIRPGTFSLVAWEAARDAAITNDVPHETLVSLGRAYSALSGYMADVRLFTSYLYTYDGQRPLRETPMRLHGWLSDLTGHAKGVQARLNDAQKALSAAGFDESAK